MVSSLAPGSPTSQERYLLAASGAALLAMLLLVVTPFASFSPPHEDVTYRSPALRIAVLAPLLAAGLAALTSAFVARLAPRRRHAALVALALAIHLLTAALIVAAGALFLIRFAGFNFESTWLRFGFWGSLAAAGGASLLCWRAIGHETAPPRAAAEPAPRVTRF